MTFEEECKQAGHDVGTCNGCGAPYCYTEGMCLAQEISGDD
jgi:hypothetical protein